MPDQSDDDDIENRQHYKGGRMRIAVAVDLVDDEKRHDDQGSRISPQPVAQQADDEGYFYKTVAQQIEGIEMLAADGKMGG